MKNEYKIIPALVGVIGLCLLAGPAAATDPMAVPEPSVLTLMGIAGVVGLVIAIRKRRK